MLLLRGKDGYSRDRPVVVAKRSSFFLLVILGILSFCQSYFVGRPVQSRPPILDCPKHEEHRTLYPLSSRLFPGHALAPLSLSSSSLEGLERDITTLCEASRFDEAIASLDKLSPDGDLKSRYVQILKSLVDQQNRVHEERIKLISIGGTIKAIDDENYSVHLHQADKILQTLLGLGENSDSDSCLPSAEDFNDVIKMWGSSTFVEEASVRCQSYLETLWSLYREKEDERFVPLHESYYHAVLACSARDRGSDAAKRAESLMEEMESYCNDHPRLTPDRSIANGVMNAWSKSGQKYKKGKKCEKVLQDMIEISQTKANGAGQNMAPDTSSFNIVLNALAQGREKNSEVRAEELLERMESLSSGNAQENSSSIALNCPPDEISFNTVLNCWAMSRQKGAAERAVAILDHMKKRYEAGYADVHPDWSTYTTVLKAWARSRDPKATKRAEAVFQEYLEACDSDQSGISHNALAYNSMINCYAKSKLPDAGKRAVELFETMKANMGKPGRELCFVDIYTYTSLIDAISKQQSYEASEQAISLLEEVEESFATTGDMRFQPNIRLYTSAVNAISRSHKSPDRAKAIVDRVEAAHLEGLAEKECKPDVVFYNSLINAYGWSDAEGRSRKSFEILKHMIALSESGSLSDAQPDTVSFNSVLNACAHDETSDQSTSDDIMKTVVEAFELLNASPEYGRPDQRTYVQVLESIARHMAKNDEKRSLMAEATFLQCASQGLVGSVVIPKLYATVPRSRFRTLMGPASTGVGNQMKFDVSELPSEWTANVYTKNGRRSRSRRMQSNFQVTKNVNNRTKNQNKNLTS